MEGDLLAEINSVEQDDRLNELNAAVSSVAQKFDQYKQILHKTQSRIGAQATRINELEEQNEAQKRRIDVLEEHNRRLCKQYAKMKKQRETDFKTIRMWQDALGIEQDSNKNSKHAKNEKKEDLDSELTQDTGPVSELTQDTGAPHSELSGSLPPSSPQLVAKRFEHDISASQMSQVLLPNSIGPEPDQEPDPDFDSSDDIDDIQSSNNKSFIDEVMNKDWHPSEFKLNTNYSENVKLRNLEFLNTLKHKETRRCMHGTNCKDCEAFYKLLNIDGAAQTGSRHRYFLPEQESPVGYWRTEFPSSASREADNLGNQNLKYSEGKSRLAEALVGGKYVFRDPELQKKAAEYMTKMQ